MRNWRKFGLGILLALFAVPSFAAHGKPSHDSARLGRTDNSPLVSIEKTGVIPTKPGQCLRLTADPGNVHIFTDGSAQVSYRVEVEADSRNPAAEEFLRQFTLAARRVPGGVTLEAQLPWRTFHGQFGVSFEIHVPREYGLKINTQGGKIDIQDIEGQVDLVTGGGNIVVGRVSPRPNMTDASGCFAPTHGGIIAAQLETKGGHISIGDVTGTLQATTAGGHITTGNVVGDAILHTGGGQIQTGRIAGVATLESGGGNIQVEKSGSSVTADTAGGQIDFGEASGAIRTHTGGGPVHIDRVSGPTVVETNGGGISLNQVDAPLRVSSSEGDIVVYLQRQLAATIDAVVEQGGEYSIVADPSFPIKISYQESGSGPRTIQGEGDLNGGGEALHLKAVSGNIILKLGEPRTVLNSTFQAAWMPGEPGPSGMQEWNPDDDAAGFFEEFRRRILESWWGEIPVDAAEMQNHLEHSVAPVYPDVARKAGVEGDVVLRVYVSSDGRVSDIRVLDGPPILARAAVEAVRQWQYQSPVFDGHPISVVSTLIVAFRLK